MAKKKKNSKLTGAQIEVMNVVWQHGHATVAQVWEALKEEKNLARNTIQTTLVRLEQKGYLRHRKKGNAFVYYPTDERSNTLRSMLKNLVNVAFEGSTAGMVMTCLLYTSPSPRDATLSRMPSSA